MRSALVGEELRLYNKQRVLDEAIKCLGENGINATKVSDIAKRAGVTTRSIERYYGGKENLLEEAVTHIVGKMFKVTAENLKIADFGDDSVTGLKWMEKFIDLQIEYFRENYLEYMSVAEIEIYFYRKNQSLSISENHLASLKSVREILVKIINYGKKDGSIRKEVEPVDVASLVSVVLQGAMLRLSIVRNNPVMEKMVALDDMKALEMTKAGILGYLENRNI